MSRAILHIPHVHMLYTQSLDHWIKKFEQLSHRRPTEIVLPGIGYGGPTFDSSVSGPPKSLVAGNRLSDWVRQARENLGATTPVWASILPALDFLSLETVMVSNQYGLRSATQACLVNEITQKVVRTFIEEMTPLGISGVAIDCTDIYPNSTSDATVGIVNNCFCAHCQQELQLNGWRHGISPFVGSGNITRLILRVSESRGADHIDPKAEWIRDGNAAALLQLSEARGFVTAEEATRREEAERLLNYLKIRAKVTATALRRVSQAARDAEIKVALVLGEADYDASTGADIESLAAAEAADEYWLPHIESEQQKSTGVSAIAYLYGRGPYFVNGLFELIEDADEQISGSGITPFIQRLLRLIARVGRLNRLSPASAFTVELAEEYGGFVGVALTVEDLVRQIEQLSSGTLGQVVPGHVIEAMIASVNLGVPESGAALESLDSATE